MSLFGMEPQRPPAQTAQGPQHAPPFLATAKASGAGVATIQMPSVPAGQVWVLERINISANSALTPTLAMYDRDPSAAGATFLDGSTSGNGDVDDRAVLVLYPNDQLTLVWAGATPGAVCRCRIQYHIEGIG